MSEPFVHSLKKPNGVQQFVDTRVVASFEWKPMYMQTTTTTTTTATTATTTTLVYLSVAFDYDHRRIEPNVAAFATRASEISMEIQLSQ